MFPYNPCLKWLFMLPVIWLAVDLVCRIHILCLWPGLCCVCHIWSHLTRRHIIDLYLVALMKNPMFILGWVYCLVLDGDLDVFQALCRGAAQQMVTLSPWNNNKWIEKGRESERTCVRESLSLSLSLCNRWKSNSRLYSTPTRTHWRKNNYRCCCKNWYFTI